MRILFLSIFAVTAVLSVNANAQEGSWASTPEGQARWNACYKETRLIHRTRNRSTLDFRAMVKDARKSHMRVCMARATPPAPVRVAVPMGNNPESALVSWAGTP
jgi:hypothetical protein